MQLTFTPLMRNRYRCNQFPKVIIKGGAIKSVRAALAKYGTARTIEGILKQRRNVEVSSGKKRRSRYRLKS